MADGEELVRSELDAAKVPASVRDASMSGFSRSHALLRPLQLQIRRCDKTLGDTSLLVLDLLDKHWGKWKLDAASKTLTFEDDAALVAYNAGIEKIDAAAAEQAEAQEQLIAKSKTLNQKSAPVAKPAVP